MIESYMMEKFIERANVLKYGFQLDFANPRKGSCYDKKSLTGFLHALCNILFRSDVSFEYASVLEVNGSYVLNFYGIMEEVKIPLWYEAKESDTIYSKSVPYRLSDFKVNKIINLKEKVLV